MKADENRNSYQLIRELKYYRREYNELGARVLRLQEEQSSAFREARRSRTVARLIREAYLLVDRTSSPEEIGDLMLEIVVENVMCDRAAILRQQPGESRFTVAHALGFCEKPPPKSLSVTSPPDFYFTTTQSKADRMASELTKVLDVPFILWAYDAANGCAMTIGNRSDGNIIRPFEQHDRELIEGALSVYVDIISRKQSEVDLREAKAKAEEANKSKSAFLATLSHELRTPLNAIIGFSEILKSDISKSFSADQWKEYASDIHSSGFYLLNLINDILDYSALAKEAPKLTEVCVGITELLESAATGVKLLANQKSITVTVSVAPELGSIMVDERRMTQVLINLMTNAIKFSPERSSVALKASTSDRDGSLAIEVHDRGVGIPENEISRVFEPFVQVGDSYKNPVKGTGLGLPISRALVEAHGGTLELRSDLGKGTVVIIHLPAWRIEGAAAARA